MSPVRLYLAKLEPLRVVETRFLKGAENCNHPGLNRDYLEKFVQ